MGFEDDASIIDAFEQMYGAMAPGWKRGGPHHYGDDIATEFTGDRIPEYHGYKHHLATGCRCEKCVAGCLKVQEDRNRSRNKPRPWSAA